MGAELLKDEFDVARKLEFCDVARKLAELAELRVDMLDCIDDVSIVVLGVEFSLKKSGAFVISSLNELPNTFSCLKRCT